MFEHRKQLLHPVGVERPNPTYAAMLQEQLGGGNGELKAALQYISQSFRVNDPAIKDLFLDIGSEELSHMEMVAQTVTLLYGKDPATRSPRPGELAGTSMESHTLSGLSAILANAGGHPFTGDYVNVTGDLAADLLSNIAAEQRAKVVYEHLYRQIHDRYVRETIDFLLNREEAHNALFREALNKVQNTGSLQDFGIDEQSRLYFNLSEPGRHFAAPYPRPARFVDPVGKNERSPVPAPRSYTPENSDRQPANTSFFHGQHVSEPTQYR